MFLCVNFLVGGAAASGLTTPIECQTSAATGCMCDRNEIRPTPLPPPPPLTGGEGGGPLCRRVHALRDSFHFSCAEARPRGHRSRSATTHRFNLRFGKDHDHFHRAPSNPRPATQTPLLFPRCQRVISVVHLVLTRMCSCFQSFF